MNTRELNIKELEKLLSDDLVFYFIKEHEINRKLYLFFAGYKSGELVSDINVPLIYRRWKGELNLYGMEIDSVYELHKNTIVEYPNPVMINISTIDDGFLILFDPGGNIQIKTCSERIIFIDYNIKIGVLFLESFLNVIYCDKLQFSVDISKLP